MRRHPVTCYRVGGLVVAQYSDGPSWRVYKSTRRGLRVYWPTTYPSAPAALRAIEEETGTVVPWPLPERPPPSRTLEVEYEWTARAPARAVYHAP